MVDLRIRTEVLKRMSTVLQSEAQYKKPTTWKLNSKKITTKIKSDNDENGSDSEEYHSDDADN